MGGGTALYKEFAEQIGATQDDLATTQQQLEEAEKAAAQAEKDAEAAKQAAADAGNETEKAQAEAEQAKAEAAAAEARMAIAADCAKAAISAIGPLFESEDASEQVRRCASSSNRSPPPARTSSPADDLGMRPLLVLLALLLALAGVTRSDADAKPARDQALFGLNVPDLKALDRSESASARAPRSSASSPTGSTSPTSRLPRPGRSANAEPCR